MATFRLAHLSDVHVFTAAALRTWTLLEPKRLLGALNVAFRRGPRAYDSDVLRAALLDARAMQTDHAVVSGDLTNLATKAEFERAAQIIHDAYGDATVVSTVPGNHDIYTASSQRHRYYHRFFQATAASTSTVDGAVDGFPYVRHVWNGRLALIGLNSAVPRPPFVASGVLGAAQLASLQRLLDSPAVRATPYKVLVLHHPPLERYSRADSARYSLQDQDALQAILTKGPGVDLVLHGHTHQPYSGPLAVGVGPRPWVFEAGSSTFVPTARKRRGHVARYNIYELHEAVPGGAIALRKASARVYNPATGAFDTRPVPYNGDAASTI